MKYDVILAMAFLVSMCGQNESAQQFGNGSQSSKTGSTTPSSADRASTNPQLIPIPVSMVQGQGSSASLALADTESSFELVAAATLYSISLSGCASGYTSTATESSTNLQVYKFDTGCLAKLTTFTINGLAYTPKAGSTFTTWQAGDTAVFEVAASPANTLNVRVVSTLASPVVATDTVVYQFYKIVKGADKVFAQAAVGAGHAMTVSGQAAPSFTIKTASYVGMTGAGAGQFQFVMECTADISAHLCLDADLHNISYQLIEDTYAGTLTYAQAAALFPGSATAVTVATDEIAVGAGGTVHGGFNTVTLNGPATINSKPNMLLVIDVSDVSYLYFKVDVTVLTQD